MVKRVDRDFQSARPAHHVQTFPLAPLSLAGPRHGIVCEVHVACDKQVNFSVAVIVNKTAARVPLVARGPEPSFFSHVSKRAVAIVVIQNILAPVCHEQVQVAVVLKIANAATLTPTRARESSLFGDVGKRPVVVVVIEMSGRFLTFWKTFHGRPVRKKNIRPAVVVVVEYNTAVPGCFNDEFFVRVATVKVLHGNACALGNVFEMHNAGFHGGWSSRSGGSRKLSRTQAREVGDNNCGRKQKKERHSVHAGPLDFGNLCGSGKLDCGRKHSAGIFIPDTPPPFVATRRGLESPAQRHLRPSSKPADSFPVLLPAAFRC